jgi:hypothetical protein
MLPCRAANGIVDRAVRFARCSLLRRKSKRVASATACVTVSQDATKDDLLDKLVTRQEWYIHSNAVLSLWAVKR